MASVVMNVTVASASTPGFLTVYPSGGLVPWASNLNFAGGQTVANLVTVRLGSDGKVAFFNSGNNPLNLVADVAGYYLAGTPTASGAFVSLAPSRVLDTRFSFGAPGPVAPGVDGTINVPLAGRYGVPYLGASAVVMNVTVTQTKTPGFITVYPSSMDLPIASNLNFSGGETVPNLLVAQLGTGGRVSMTNSSGGTVQLVGDVAGYFIK